jgi:predicted AAA+ superfamily ATPase
MKKLEKVVEETSRELKKNVGGLHNSFGTLIEHLVAPNIAEKFNEFGYHFNRIFNKGLEIYENGRTITEVDIVLENDKTIALIEIKAKPNMRDINDHLERMQMVRRDFERSGNRSKELIGAIAGAIFSDFVKKFAIESGFYVLTQTGDTIKIDVPENFKPRIF